MPYTIGIDYGTNQVRALVVDVADGRELGGGVVDYPSGRGGILLDPRDHHLARQHPGDYLFGLEESVKAAVAQAHAADPAFKPSEVLGIGVDSTGSSPLPVNEEGIPLASHDEWKDNLHAQCWLWKDHTSHREAARITELAAAHHTAFAPHVGWSGAICVAAGLQLAAAAETTRTFECMVYENPLRDRLAKVPVGEAALLQNGLMPIPTGPGLGIEIDRAVLDAFRAA